MVSKLKVVEIKKEVSKEDERKKRGRKPKEIKEIEEPSQTHAHPISQSKRGRKPKEIKEIKETKETKEITNSNQDISESSSIEKSKRGRKPKESNGSKEDGSKESKKEQLPITPKIKNDVWKTYTSKSSSQAELKKIFLGDKPTESYNKIKEKLKKELNKKITQ